ncbi:MULTISPECIES: plasmid partition protein ParG [Stenotrophomonas maltophilia group]|uniref:plasmid partition protein ParG n=1 Tax=Stenotrophomonas maltophilia group TaxID=995085 RepID=UPI003CE46584
MFASDGLVGGRNDLKESGRMKRLTIDIPESLHRQIKASCAQRGAKIADELRALLAEQYGKV